MLKNTPIKIGYFCILILILRERERERERAGEGPGESKRERIPSRVLAVSTEPDAGFELTNGEIMT